MRYYIRAMLVEIKKEGAREKKYFEGNIGRFC